MRLVRVSIENFRSIKKCSVYLKDLNAIIGENNAGKTALLRAINSVFNWEDEERFFLDNTHQSAPRTRTNIVLEFDKVPSKPLYEGRMNGERFCLQFTYAYGNTTRKRTLNCLVGSEKVQLDDGFLAEMKKDIDYVYVPASRGNRDLTWRDASVFQKVLTTYAQQYTQSRDSISAQVVRTAEKLKKSVFKKIEEELKKTRMLDENEEFSFEYVDGIDYSVFLDKVGIHIVEEGKSFPVTEYGSGVKSLSVIALYRALAKAANVNVILGLEEPETNLHPHAQKKLIASIKHNRQETEVQAIMATHSTVIIDELKHEDIILTRRVKDAKRVFYTDYTQLPPDFLEQNFKDNNDPDFFRYQKFFMCKNSAFFFAKYVIITESTTDAQVIEHLIQDALGEKMHYISILPLGGETSLKYPYFLLKELKIPFCMVVDMDVLTAYQNGELDKSRAAETFLPMYTGELKSHNQVLEDLWQSQEEQQAIRQALQKSYTAVFDVCKKVNLFPMQYCLEMDLVENAASRSRYCELFKITDDQTAYRQLLDDRKSKIKRPENVLGVVSKLKPVQYPYSYKKIRTAIVDSINSSVPW